MVPLHRIHSVVSPVALNGRTHLQSALCKYVIFFGKEVKARGHLCHGSDSKGKGERLVAKNLHIDFQMPRNLHIAP